MKEFLSWLCLFGGLAAVGTLTALFIAYIERRRERSRDIYYLYMIHMEKSSDRRRAHQNVNRCVCCGEIIPEGRQVCPTCEDKNG